MLRYLCTHYIYLNDIMIKIKKKNYGNFYINEKKKIMVKSMPYYFYYCMFISLKTFPAGFYILQLCY